MRIVIVGGLPCSGKSKLVEYLRTRCSYPSLCKDEFKETLFECVGVGDRDWSRKLSRAAYGIMFAQAEELLRCGIGCILEGNFREREHADHFARLAALDARFVQVLCRAQPEILVKRFHERAHFGVRHPGHVDIASMEEIERELRSSDQKPLTVEGALFECDTTQDWQQAIALTAEAVLSELADRPPSKN
jgi:predicted kinase